MNDELSGQLTDTWPIPRYAQKFLWLDSAGGSSQVEGEHGLFELPVPADVVTVRWGSDAGPALAQLRWQADNLAWDGSVRVAGLVEALHLTEFAGIVLAVVFVSAQPLRPAATAYPDSSQRLHVDLPDYLAHVDDSDAPQGITLLVGDDSPLLQVAQDALLQSIPLHLYGRLSGDDSGWHTQFALPILWESVTMFAP